MTSENNQQRPPQEMAPGKAGKALKTVTRTAQKIQRRPMKHGISRYKRKTATSELPFFSSRITRDSGKRGAVSGNSA